VSSEDGSRGGDDDVDPFAFPEDREEEAPHRSSHVPAGGAHESGEEPPAAGRAPVPSDQGPDDEQGARSAVGWNPADAIGRRVDTVGGRWLLGMLAVIVVLVGLLVTLGGRDAPVGDLGPGDRLPAFAAPLATEPRLDFDAVNLAERDDQGDAGSVAACGVRNRSVVTSCALLERGPLVLVLFDPAEPGCSTAVDTVERLGRDLPRVGTLAVARLGEHDDTARLVRARGWRVPVAYDRDGAFARRLGDPPCQAVFLIRRDGVVAERLLGTAGAAQVGAAMRRLSRP